MKQIITFFLTVFLLSCTSNQEKIGIQPYGDIPSPLLDSISTILGKSYQAEIVFLEKKDLPQSAFVNIKSPRYRADSLLINLLEGKPDSIDYIIGVTSRDISTTKRDPSGKTKQPESKYYDWGVFGLGYRPGNSCIISTYRLKDSSAKKYYDRIQKVSVHEIGHNMGLKHCESKNCVMQDAVDTILTIDHADKHLCTKCKNKI